MSDLRYPTGPFRPHPTSTRSERDVMIRAIEEAPEELTKAVSGLDEKQLDTVYREGGWTARQVVHHVADSHMMGYVRLKLALTEDDPTVKPYDEAAWAELADLAWTPVSVSLLLVEGLHRRFVAAFRNIDDAGFRRPFEHPERGHLTVDWLLQLYSWHGRHHAAHITALRNRMGW